MRHSGKLLAKQRSELPNTSNATSKGRSVWTASWIEPMCWAFPCSKVTRKVSTVTNVLQQDSHLNINVLQLTCHPYHGADHRLLASEFWETILTGRDWLVIVVVLLSFLISKPAVWCAHEAKECERVLVRRIILDGLCIVFRVLTCHVLKTVLFQLKRSQSCWNDLKRIITS